MLWLYIARNFAKIMGLESPEPLANLYSRSYFRATWVTTALDAGFWTAMKIRRKWLRDLASLVFSVYYLIAAEQADEKVRKVRATLTVDHLRVAWNKSTTPYLSFFTRLLRPRLARYSPRRIRIPRPNDSSYNHAIDGWLYFDGPLTSLRKHTNIILDIPGGGFVAMDPRNSDDKLLAWAGKTGLPILSLNYRKAPEHPYPYALNECYDVYRTLVASRGRCIGMTGAVPPRIVVTGDSAGGNLATGLVLMILQSGGTDSRRWHGETSLPPPAGLVLIYPGLDVNIGNWMSDEQMSLIKDRRMRKTNRNVIRRKSEDYYKLDPATPHPSDDEEDEPSPKRRVSLDRPESPTLSMQPSPSAAHISRSNNLVNQTVTLSSSKPKQLRTRLAMSSMISYFNDRILTPEMMRAMIILYVGPHNRPDFGTDFLLSPLLAPEGLLSKFPKTYFLTGERDPLVDDTVIFAARIRTAKFNLFRERQEMGLESPRAEFNEKDHVEVALIPGISHGFLQFVSVFPEGWRHVFRCARWIEEIFASASEKELMRLQIGNGSSSRTLKRNSGATSNSGTRNGSPPGHHHNRSLTSSSAEDENPLEMSSIRPSSATPTQSSVNSNTSRRKLSRKDPGRDRGYTQRESEEQGSPVMTKSRSLVSLASSDDLLGRRMKELAGGLTGAHIPVRTP
jgi:acetyl esterase/lipase